MKTIKIITIFMALTLILAFIPACKGAEPGVTEEPAAEVPEEEPEEPVFAMYRGNLERTGVYESDPVKSLKGVKWQTEIGRVRCSAAVIDNSILYIGTGDTIKDENHLYALDIATGEQLWKFSAEEGFEASAAVDDGIVYIGDNGGNFYALDGNTGSPVWDFKIEEGITSTAAVVDGVVYFGGGDTEEETGYEVGYIFALDAQTGDELWRFKSDELGIEHHYTIKTTPAISGSSLYYRTGRHTLVALDIQTGQQKWVSKIGGLSLPAGSLPPSPAVYKDTVFCGSMDGSFYAIDGETGEVIWSFDTGDYVHSSPAFYDDMAFIGGWAEAIFAINIDDGKEVWRFELEGTWINSPPSVAGDVVYFGADDGILYALDAKTGNKLWQFETGGNYLEASPAIAGGVVYIGASDGYIYALD